VRVPLSMGGGGEGDDDEERRRRSAREMLSMVVDGDKCWIITDSGEELPLDSSAATKPSLSCTWIPKIARSVWRCATTDSKAAMEPVEASGVESDTKTERKTQFSEGGRVAPDPSKVLRRGRRRKPVSKR